MDDHAPTYALNVVDDTPATTMSNITAPWVSDPVAQKILRVLHVAYPIILIILFLGVFTIRSIVTASTDNEFTKDPQQLGPGGKPLPKKTKKDPAEANALDFSRPRKLLFQWLSVGVIGTILANIVVVIVHALYAREEQWWCGQALVVGQCLAKADRHTAA